VATLHLLMERNRPMWHIYIYIRVWHKPAKDEFSMDDQRRINCLWHR
jgi:hypothetical protein